MREKEREVGEDQGIGVAATMPWEVGNGFLLGRFFKRAREHALNIAFSQGSSIYKPVQRFQSKAILS
jgi:hypothetical protein